MSMLTLECVKIVLPSHNVGFKSGDTIFVHVYKFTLNKKLTLYLSVTMREVISFHDFDYSVPTIFLLN